ncbi:MAG: CpsB/CapC family capsule biosynthesis tyrosine phosphatase [Acidobacteriota bacterium]
MVDIHCHLLPGIDDGPATMEDSLAMCAMLLEDGCDAVVATPHQRHELWPNEDLEALETLRAEVESRAPRGLSVHLGAEIRVNPELVADLANQSTGIQPLAGGRHLLIEFDRRQPPPAPGAAALVHELVVAGWRPILAHPELIPWLSEDLDELTALVRAGARCQVTAMSVTGEFGRWAHERCSGLLEAGLVHVVASDAHSPRRRPPGLRAAHRWLAEHHGDALAERLTTTYPAAVLLDGLIPEDPLQ